MLQEFYMAVYSMSFPALAICTALILIISAALHALIKGRARQLVGLILTICVLLIILYVTMIGRSEPETGLLLIPGNSIVRAFYSEVYLRMVLLNIFVFVPYGAYVTLILSRYGRRITIIWTLLSGLILTVLIEALQFIMGLGCAETDDVICNMAGVAIGLIPYLLTYRAAGERTE